MTTAPPLRVLLLIGHPRFPRGVVHGPGRLLLEQLPRLDPALVRPTLCVLREPHPLAAQFEQRGFPPVFLGRAKWDPRALPDLVRLVRATDADLLHLLGEKAMILGRIAARRTRRRAIIHLRDTKHPGRAVRLLARLLAPHTDLALGCADAVTDLAVSDWAIPRDRARTLLNGIDVDRFASPSPGARERIREELAIPADAPVVAVVGRMAPEKGHELLIRAVPFLRASCPSAVLLIAGDGPTRPACQTAARELNIAGAIRFAGQRTDIPDLLAASDVVALPSLWGEGLPGVVVEAIAAARPVVAFPVAGTTDVVLHGRTGLVVPQGDAPAMAAAIARLLTDHALRAHLQRGCTEHRDTFRIEENVRRLQSIYLEVAGRPPAGAAERPAPTPHHRPDAPIHLEHAAPATR